MKEYAAKRLINVRKDLNLTQTELAEIVSFKSENIVDIKTVYRWEKGLAPVPAWVLLHLEMLRTEFEIEKTEESIKRSLGDKKDALVDSVLNKVRGFLKGDL